MRALARVFEYELYLGGPPDKRSSFPYKQPIQDAFSDLRIYDWETCIKPEYQNENHLVLTKTQIMVAMVPSFPMPGIGPEVGYFYCHNQHEITSYPDIPRIIFIWPDDVRPDFTKKTLGQYGPIVTTTEAAIDLIRDSILKLKAMSEVEEERFNKEDEDDPPLSKSPNEVAKGIMTIIENDPNQQGELPMEPEKKNPDKTSEDPLFSRPVKEVANDLLTLLEITENNSAKVNDDPYLLNHHPWKKGGPYPGPSRTGL